jgi:hypothetical protein
VQNFLIAQRVGELFFEKRKSFAGKQNEKPGTWIVPGEKSR